MVLVFWKVNSKKNMSDNYGEDSKQLIISVCWCKYALFDQNICCNPCWLTKTGPHKIVLPYKGRSSIAFVGRTRNRSYFFLSICSQVHLGFVFIVGVTNAFTAPAWRPHLIKFYFSTGRSERRAYIMLPSRLWSCTKQYAADGEGGHLLSRNTSAGVANIQIADLPVNLVPI